MKKQDIENMFSVVREDDRPDGEIRRIIIKGWNEELPIEYVTGRDDVTSAVYAGVDYLRLGDYDHPLTDVGLHLKVITGTRAARLKQKNVGAIQVGTMVPDGITMLSPNLADHPTGWAQINRVDGIYVLVQPEDPEVFARKHTHINGLMKGYTIVALVPAFLARPKDGDPSNGIWAENMVENLFETNDGKARQLRDDRIASFHDRNRLYEPIRRAKKADNIGSVIAGTNGETQVTMTDNTVIPLAELVMGRYKVYNGNRIIQTLKWDGGVDAVALVAMTLKNEWKLKKI